LGKKNKANDVICVIFSKDSRTKELHLLLKAPFLGCFEAELILVEIKSSVFQNQDEKL